MLFFFFLFAGGLFGHVADRNVRPMLDGCASSSTLPFPASVLSDVDRDLAAVKAASDVAVLYRPYFTSSWLSGSSHGPTPSGICFFSVSICCILFACVYSCVSMWLFGIFEVLPTPVVSRVDAAWNRRKRRILRNYYTGRTKGALCFFFFFAVVCFYLV